MQDSFFMLSFVICFVRILGITVLVTKKKKERERMYICVKLSHSAEFCTMLQINYVSIKKGKTIRWFHCEPVRLTEKKILAIPRMSST